MPIIIDNYVRILGLLFAFAVPIVLLAVPALVIGAVAYVLAGPETRLRMLGWAPGFDHGVRTTLGLVRELQDPPPAESE